MMQFKTTMFGTEATNSLRPVVINKSNTGESFLLEMEEGTLDESLDVRRHFDTFEEAVRFAEANIGVKLTLKRKRKIC